MKYMSFTPPLVAKTEPPDQWTAQFPSPPDNVFNYFNLMSKCLNAGTGIGVAPAESASEPICVVGAGVAGITAARELVRCGFTVELREAGSRIGGRHDTRDVAGQATAMEMGAMRFPFFSTLDAEKPGPGSKNCLLDYYFNTEAKGNVTPFTNPGQTKGGTGIWINDGLGPNGTFPTPKLINWDDGAEPDDPDLKFINDRVSNFVRNVQTWLNGIYGQPGWAETWASIVGYYSRMSVEDMVFADFINQADPSTPVYPNNWLGGLGFNQKQSELFYTIGSGDGSWGAFYQVGSLWFLRCVMFGFQNNLQALIDIPASSGNPHKGQTVTDSAGTSFQGPKYKGIQSLDEWLFYSPIPGLGTSLYDLAHAGSEKKQFTFYVKSPVTGLAFSSTGVTITGSGGSSSAAHVILTPTLSSVERHMEITESGSIEDPATRITRERAIKTQHNINSCKVFYPLNETYWENSKSNIPQNIVTDTVVQDAYGVKWSDDPEDHGVLLVSYTWEDEAAKLIADMDKPVVLAKYLLNQLDDITVSALGEKVSNYVSDTNEPTIIHWGGENYFRACAKLYRSRNEAYNKVLLIYNNLDKLETDAKPIERLFLAGENYSTEGGWTEPALRGAIDAVINVVRRTGGTFNVGFDYTRNYLPKISVPDVSDAQARYPYPPRVGSPERLK